MISIFWFILLILKPSNTKQKYKTSCENILFIFSLPFVVIVILKKEKEPPVLLIQTTSNKLVLSEINVNWHRKTKVIKF